VHHEAQVRQHQLARRLDIVVVAEARRERGFFLAAQHRDAADRVEIRVEAPDRAGEGQFGGTAADERCRGHVIEGNSQVRLPILAVGILEC